VSGCDYESGIEQVTCAKIDDEFSRRMLCPQPVESRQAHFVAAALSGQVQESAGMFVPGGA
jgi:hypothetical protein